MDIFIKCCAVAAVGSVFALLLRKNSPVISLLLAAAVGCAVVAEAMEILWDVTDFFAEISDGSNVSTDALALVMKTVGIAVITRFSSDLCRDAGMASAASAVELAGSAAAVFIALPVMRAVFQMIEGAL